MTKDKPARQTVTLRDRNYQLAKIEKEEKFSVVVPGRTVVERMDNFGGIVTHPVNLRYRKSWADTLPNLIRPARVSTLLI